MQDNYRKYTVELQDYTNEELVELFQQTQSEEYLRELMVKNKSLIYLIANSYTIPYYDVEDLLSVGYEALWKAVKNYDKENGFFFTTFLKGCVTQAYNRLYNEANRVKRGKGAMPTSWEALEEISREKPTKDDYSIFELEEFLDSLKGVTRTVAELLTQGLGNGEIAKILNVKPASVTYHFNKIRQAYLQYSGEAM